MRHADSVEKNKHRPISRFAIVPRSRHSGLWNICANPSRIVLYFGRQPSSVFFFFFYNGNRVEVMRARYGETSFGSQAGTLNGFGEFVYSAMASTISDKRTARSSTMS